MWTETAREEGVLQVPIGLLPEGKGFLEGFTPKSGAQPYRAGTQCIALLQKGSPWSEVEPEGAQTVTEGIISLKNQKKIFFSAMQEKHGSPDATVA